MSLTGDRLFLTQCHPELACLAAIGKSAVGMTEVRIDSVLGVLVRVPQ